MPFEFKRLAIPDCVLIRPVAITDGRGFFSEIFKDSDYARAGIGEHFCQANQSRSDKNILRGLHYQLEPMAQAKLVRVLSGEIYDIIIDIRKGSPFYGKSLGVPLGSDPLELLYVPPGFAHGFCVLSDNADVEYFCSKPYSKPHERGICYNDPALHLDWPVREPVVSDKDARLPTFEQAEKNFIYEKK